MPRRSRESDEDSDEYLSRKLRKIERKIRRRNRRRSRSENTSNLSSDMPMQSIPEDARDIMLTEITEPELLEVIPNSNVVPLEDPQPGPSTGELQPALENPEIDEELLILMGEAPSCDKKYGSQIQKDLAIRWEHFSLKGLTKEVRKELIDKYMTPENCKKIDAPILNPEIKAALSEWLLKKDKALELKQKQLAASISCLGQALTKMLSAEQKDSDTIKLIFDAGKMICDSQHTESLTRRSFICTSLKKETKDQLYDTEIDKYLFSEKLSETLKAAKAINKSASEMKNTPPVPYKPVVQRNKAPVSKNFKSQLPYNRQAAAARRQQEPAPPAPAITSRAPPPHSRRKPPPPPPQPRSYARGPPQQITNDPVILSWVHGYKILFVYDVHQHNVPQQPRLSAFELLEYQEAVDDLLNINAISECNFCEDQYLSSYFLIKKPNGKNRFILNLKSLNKFIVTEHFKIEDLRTTLKLLSKDCFMATLDLKDAYFFISIDEAHRKYLRFKWCNKLYQFNVLPFGLSTAPFVFTKLLKPVMGLLRSMGHTSTVFLDDVCLIGRSFNQCINNVDKTKLIFESLGFTINYEKSCLVPNTICKYLGFEIDTQKFHVKLTVKKRNLILNEVKNFLNKDRCRVREFARLLGLLTSSCPAIQYGWLYTKQMERCKYLALLKNEDYNSYMSLPNYISEDLIWWQSSIINGINPIRDDNYCMELFSDASKKGWGVACGEDTASGQWTVKESEMHINYLELKAAFFGLKIFARDLKNVQILLRIDNTTAIAYVNRMGGVKFPHLSKLSKDLWQWCECHNIFVFACYISSRDNVVADAESRKIHPDTEWELNDDAFNKITSKFGAPEIDLFASRINKKCNTFISWHRDPDAYANNAFTVDWGKLHFYAFPPVAIILKVLRKIIFDKAEGIVLVPFWPTQPWYPMYRDLLVSETLLLEANEALSLSNRHPKMTLLAGRLSGWQC